MLGHGIPAASGQFGRAILLGLGFLVAADIIGTVVITPSRQDQDVVS